LEGGKTEKELLLLLRMSVLGIDAREKGGGEKKRKSIPSGRVFWGQKAVRACVLVGRGERGKKRGG